MIYIYIYIYIYICVCVCVNFGILFSFQENKFNQNEYAQLMVSTLYKRRHPKGNLLLNSSLSLLFFLSDLMYSLFIYSIMKIMHSSRRLTLDVIRYHLIIYDLTLYFYFFKSIKSLILTLRQNSCVNNDSFMQIIDSSYSRGIKCQL